MSIHPEKLLSKKLPLSAVLIAPFAVLTILIVSLVGYISYINGEQAVNQIAYQLRGEITERIHDHLIYLLTIPQQITAASQNAVLLDHERSNDMQELQDYFLNVVKAYPVISSAYFGNTQGGLVGSNREGAGNDYYVYHTENLQVGRFSKYSLDDQGRARNLVASVPNFDARTRPWYQAAVMKQGAVWSSIYILSTGQDMAIAASRPVYDAQGAMLGVTAVDLFLSQLDSFLNSIYFSPNGKSFIIERSGLLVAASTGEQPFIQEPGSSKLVRIAASDSQNPVIRQAARFLEQRSGGFDGLPTHNEDLRFTADGQRIFLQLTPLQNDYGIDWIVVVVLPEADFMAQINANNRATGLIILLSLILGLGLSILFGRMIAQRIYRVSAATQALANGNWEEALASSSRIDEINTLSQSYNQMARQLHDLLDNLKKEIEERRHAEHSLAESEDRYRTLVENVPVGVFRAAPVGVLEAANPALLRLLHLEDEPGLPDRPMNAWFAHSQEYDSFIEKVLHAPYHAKGEFRLLRAGGESFWGAITAQAVFQETENEAGQASLASELKHIDGVLEDISERKAVQDLTQRSLQEKETLLKELYHRTKNNMQVINSLLQMQTSEEDNEHVHWVFQNMQNRIHAMSLVHEKLYTSHNLTSIDLKDYVEDLAHHLVASYRFPTHSIELELQIEPISLPLDLAIPIGLVLNELITNALKYAFPDSRDGQIWVSIRRSANQHIEMRVTDNGVGIPASAVARNARKMGLSTVFSIVEHQLQGRVRVISTPGAQWLIDFPEQIYTPRL